MTTVNLEQAAVLLDVSIPTVKSWIRSGMPVLKAGTNGEAYELDSSAIVTWRDERQAEIRQRREAVDAELRQFTMDLGGDDEVGPAELSLDDKLKATRLANERLKLAIAMGEMLPVTEVRRVWSGVMTEARAALLGLPDQMAKFGEMSREQRALVDQTIRAALNRLADGVKGLDVPGNGAGPDGERGGGGREPGRSAEAA